MEWGYENDDVFYESIGKVLEYVAACVSNKSKRHE
jgi:hypothetical protein